MLVEWFDAELSNVHDRCNMWGMNRVLEHLWVTVAERNEYLKECGI